MEDKRIAVYQQIQQQNQINTGLDILKGKPFYCGKPKDDDCFNHLIGLPTKNAITYPLFEYERDVYTALQQGKYLWIKKATGLGITEFILRYMAWLALQPKYQIEPCQFCIVTGPNEELAIILIQRFKDLFRNYTTFDTDKKTVKIGNNVTINAYPSNHLDAMRSLKNPKFIFLDEADFFRIGEQQNARDVSERYIGKSDPYIVMVSTPNVPGGLFEQIEEEKESLYHRLYFPYTVGLNKIYTEEEIDKVKASPSFEREYNLKYGWGVGNIFLPPEIDHALSIPYTLQVSPYCDIFMGIDPGFGSSKFAINIIMLEDSIIKVMYASEFDRAGFNDMVNLAAELFQRYHPNKIFVDGSNPAFIAALKGQIGENQDYNNLIDIATKQKQDYTHMMRVVPINFATEHKEMLGKARYVLSKHWCAISKDFKGLVNDLRIARLKENGNLNKETATHDALDAFRLSLKGFDLPTMI